MSKIRLPPGFQISVWADGVANVRSLAQSPGGTVFAGTWNAGNVYALRDDNKDGRTETESLAGAGTLQMCFQLAHSVLQPG